MKKTCCIHISLKIGAVVCNGTLLFVEGLVIEIIPKLMRCQFCIDAHSQRAITAGATKEEVAEAISVVMFVAAGSQIGWTNIYGENIDNKIFEKNKEEKDYCCCCKD